MTILDESASNIESMIETWRDRLLGLDPNSIHTQPDPDRWSIPEVVGHLVESVCNSHQRSVRAQYGSELIFPKFEQKE